MSKEYTKMDFNSLSDDSILIADQTAVRINVQVDNTNITADSNGIKWLKAGTPVGNTTKSALTDRTTVLAKSVVTDSSGVTATPNPQGIIYRDVNVTNSPANAVLIVAGTVDILKIDETIRTDLLKITDKLPKITFIAGRED